MAARRSYRRPRTLYLARRFPTVAPAFHVSGMLGSNVGGLDPVLTQIYPTAKADSWLTVGLTDGNSNSALAAVGIDWTKWTRSNGLRITDGAVFWMDTSVAGRPDKRGRLCWGASQCHRPRAPWRR